MATVVASAKLPTSIEPPEFNVTTPPVNVVSVIVQPPTLPPVNNTCEPVTLPPAETLNLLDEIKDVGSVTSAEDEILQNS